MENNDEAKRAKIKERLNEFNNIVDEAVNDGKHTQFTEYALNASKTLVKLTTEGRATKRSVMIFASEDVANKTQMVLVGGASVDAMAKMFEAAIREDMKFKMAMMMALMKSTMRDDDDDDDDDDKECDCDRCRAHKN